MIVTITPFYHYLIQYLKFQSSLVLNRAYFKRGISKHTPHFPAPISCQFWCLFVNNTVFLFFTGSVFEILAGLSTVLAENDYSSNSAQFFHIFFWVGHTTQGEVCSRVAQEVDSSPQADLGIRVPSFLSGLGSEKNSTVWIHFKCFFTFRCFPPRPNDYMATLHENNVSTQRVFYFIIFFCISAFFYLVLFFEVHFHGAIGAYFHLKYFFQCILNLE